MSRDFPFVGVVGKQEAKRALLIACLNPAVGGIVLMGEKGSAKSVLVCGLRELFPDRKFTAIPLSVSTEHLVGKVKVDSLVRDGVVIKEKGLLDADPGEILYLDEVNLFRDGIVDLMLANSGQKRASEEPVFAATMNPEEGHIRKQLLEQFGLCVQVNAETDPELRLEVMKSRMAFDDCSAEMLEKWDKETELLRSVLKTAEEMLPRVALSDEILRLAAEIVMEAGCVGNRAELLLVEAAKAIAALEQKPEVTTEHLKEASRYVLPHRMARENLDVEQIVQDNESTLNDQTDDLPDSPEDEEQYESQSELPPGDMTPSEEETSDADNEEQPDEDILEQLKLKLPNNKDARKKYSGVGKRNRTTADVKTGHMIRSVDKPKGELALADTIREAAMHKHSREVPEGVALAVKKEDFRRQVKEGRTGATILFVVDASGSMGAKKRMRAVKSAVLALLKDAYEKRDKAGIICFRGQKARVVLTPTRSVDLARKKLARMPVGGRTPLADGLAQAHRLFAEERQRETNVLQYMVLLTDGKANASSDGSDAKEEARVIAEKIKASGVKTMVLDTENPYVSIGFAKELSEVMGSTYETLHFMSGEEIQNKTLNFIRRN